MYLWSLKLKNSPQNEVVKVSSLNHLIDNPQSQGTRGFPGLNSSDNILGPTFSLKAIAENWFVYSSFLDYFDPVIGPASEVDNLF